MPNILLEFIAVKLCCTTMVYSSLNWIVCLFPEAVRLTSRPGRTPGGSVSQLPGLFRQSCESPGIPGREIRGRHNCPPDLLRLFIISDGFGFTLACSRHRPPILSCSLGFASSDSMIPGGKLPLFRKSAMKPMSLAKILEEISPLQGCEGMVPRSFSHLHPAAAPGRHPLNPQWQPASL